jgi:hypothetical protein
MSDGGKGSSPRPFSVPKEEFDKSWDTIFKKEKTNEDGEILLGKIIQDKEKVSED